MDHHGPSETITGNQGPSWTFTEHHRPSVLLFPHIAAIINSDFDDHHDSPKGEVNPNVLVNSNDVSDIFKQFVDDKGVSFCLKSLWKTTLCKLHLSL